MKYVVNQPFDFSNPGSAFFVALMQVCGGLAAEMACILYLGSINVAIDVIIKFVALPGDGNKIKKGTKPLMITVHKRDWITAEEQSRDPKIDAQTNILMN